MDYYKFFIESEGERDPIFDDALNYLDGKPAKILEIGALRDLSKDARIGDGWSSFHFSKYIFKYGGSLTVCDINDDSLSNCKKALANLEIDKVFNNIDGSEFLKNNPNEKYDLVFLDGGDDPSEMYKQYLLVKDRASFILCDDYHAKGKIMDGNGVPVIKYVCYNGTHQMALTYDGCIATLKTMVR